MNRQLSPGRILLGFTCIIAIRTFLEVFSRRRSLFLYDDFHRMVVYYLHPYLAWLSLFAAIALLIAFFMNLRYREGVLFTLRFSPLIMIVPLVDTVVGGGRAGAVKYGESFDAFIHDFIHLFDPFAAIAMVTTGVRVEVFLVVAGSLLFGLFVFKRGIARSLGLALSIYSVIFLFGYLPAIYALGGWSPDDLQSLAATGLLSEQALFFLYLIPAAVIALLTGALLARDKVPFKPSLVLIPAAGLIPVALAVGAFFYTASWLELTDRIMNPGDLLKLGTALLSLYLLFLADVQRTGDRTQGAAPVLLTLSALFGAAAAASFVPFWLSIASVIVLYGSPPCELRRIPVIRHLGEPLIAVAALLAGTSMVLPYGPWRPYDGKGAELLLLILAVTALSVGMRRWKLRLVKK